MTVCERAWLSAIVPDVTASRTRYDLLVPLASGGMGTVYIARVRASAAGWVAVKTLRAEAGATAEMRTMFLDEARIVSHIQHPNVVRVIDVVDDGGELQLVMEYVDGPSLFRLLREVLARNARVPVPVAVALVLDVLAGLQAAHDARTSDGRPLRVVHRDVSPQNVMVDREGRARLVDFGVAHAVDRAQLTMPGEVKGKAGYMAPEQVRGGAVDGRADTYAAAIVLWELLTGQRLFAGESFAASMLKQLQQVPEPPGRHRSEVPATLDSVVLRALSKEPAARHASAAELAAALARASPPAPRAEVAAFFRVHAAQAYQEQSEVLARAEAAAATGGAEGIRADGELGERAPTVAEIRARARRPSRRVAYGLLAALTLALSARLGLARRAAPDAVPRAAVPATAQDSAVAAGESTPAPREVAPTLPPRQDASDASSPAVDAHGAAATRTPRTPRKEAPRTAGAPASSAPAAASTARAPLPPCCVGGLQIRYRDCLDNCAAP
jgi:hypothetical protein